MGCCCVKEFESDAYYSGMHHGEIGRVFSELLGSGGWHRWNSGPWLLPLGGDSYHHMLHHVTTLFTIRTKF
jgi:hypothetical protein